METITELGNQNASLFPWPELFYNRSPGTSAFPSLIVFYFFPLSALFSAYNEFFSFSSFPWTTSSSCPFKVFISFRSFIYSHFAKTFGKKSFRFVIGWKFLSFKFYDMDLTRDGWKMFAPSSAIQKPIKKTDSRHSNSWYQSLVCVTVNLEVPIHNYAGIFY